MTRLVFDLSWVVFVELTRSCTFSIWIDKIIVLVYLKLFQIDITDEAHWIPLTNWYLRMEPDHLFDLFGVLNFKSIRVVIIEQSQMHMTGIWIFASENINAWTPCVEKWYPVSEANCEILQILGNGRSWVKRLGIWIGLIILSEIPHRNLTRKKKDLKIKRSTYFWLQYLTQLTFWERERYTWQIDITSMRCLFFKTILTLILATYIHSETFDDDWFRMAIKYLTLYINFKAFFRHWNWSATQVLKILFYNH